VSTISDEMLMAYADGELDGSDCAGVESYLANSSDGVSRLSVFAATGRGLAGMFEQPMLEPVPKRLLDAVHSGATVRTGRTQGGKPLDHVIAFGRTQRGAAPFARRDWALLAASVAALAIVGGAYGFRPQPAAGEMFATKLSQSGERIAVAELASALDVTRSRVTAARDIAGTAVTIKPVLTFATANKDYCRQYVISRPGPDAIGGVACRDSSSQWQIKTQVAIAPEKSTEGSIAPSGKDGNAVIGAAIDGLIKGNALDGEQEDAVLKSGWTK
jgi:hypothetical protein